jgi:hypothetical protein
MRKVKRSVRAAALRGTGRIPAGSDVHHRHLRNPNLAYLRRVIRETEALISSGECHADWGRKRLEGLQKLLKAKELRLRWRRVSKKA